MHSANQQNIERSHGKDSQENKEAGTVHHQEEMKAEAQEDLGTEARKTQEVKAREDPKEETVSVPGKTPKEEVFLGKRAFPRKEKVSHPGKTVQAMVGIFPLKEQELHSI